MPGRVSARSTAQGPKARTQRKKSTKRALDAFAIAGHTAKQSRGPSRHRLGEIEPDGSSQKRRRASDADEGEDEDGDGDDQRTKKPKTADDSDYEYSDGEGHTYKLGHVDASDDSEIDSDEAFASSDESQFEGFSFRASKSAKKPKKAVKARAARNADVSLDEGDSDDAEDSGSDGLGADAVDLATMLDDDHVSEVSTSGDSDAEADRQSESEDDGSESDTEESDRDEDDGDDADPEKLAKLQDLVASLENVLGDKRKSAPNVDAHEAQIPSSYGLTSSQKLRVADLLPTVTDPALRKSLKVLAADKPSKRAGIPSKLEAPLPKRQQDRLDRAAANQKAKETLERWRDTVIQNRRADHLQFPLKDPDAQEPVGTKRLVAVQQDKPQNDLESAIQDILETSGLSSKKRDEDEKRIQQAEELQTNKMPIEEVMARRAELRRARELLFREEVRAKRVKKIKSKSYRRVHRKERERQRQIDQGFMDPDGVEVDEDEKQLQDRRRAEARMSAKHRESKWAKNMKQSGRTAWDDDAREGMIDMARRNEELRKRIEGKDVDEGNDASSVQSYHTSDGSEDEDEDQETAARKRLGKEVDRLDFKDNAATTKLGNMGFMQRADAARKRQTDETIEEIRRDLAGEEGEPRVVPETQLGRRIFGPASEFKAKPAKPTEPRAEMEERAGSDDEEADKMDIVVEKSAPTPTDKNTQAKTTKRNTSALSQPVQTSNADSNDDDDDPWLTAATGNKKKKSQANVKEFIPAETTTASAVSAQIQQVKKPRQRIKKSARGTPVGAAALADQANGPDAESDSDSDEANQNGILTEAERQSEYHRRAFAGDEAEVQFATEKKTQQADEDEKFSSNHLPGWGSWTGDGLTKSIKRNNSRQAHNPLFKSKIKDSGVRVADRKDAKLKNVIITEAALAAGSSVGAGSRKNKKYLASQLPHEFEKKAQYERSLRIPIGPEWTTKDTFQRQTKPRVIVKQGIIEPMSKPTV